MLRILIPSSLMNFSESDGISMNISGTVW